MYYQRKKKFFWTISSLKNKQKKTNIQYTLDIIYILGQSQFPAVFSLSIPPVLFLMTLHRLQML